MLSAQIVDLPANQLSRQAVAPNQHTHWTYQAYDNLFYKHSRYEAYRTDSSVLIPYFLTPNKRFVGEESYVETVEIPQEWEDHPVTLFLERVHIVSHVWVNGVEARSLYVSPQVEQGCRSLGAPHRYDLTGLLQAGEKNELRIVVDNRLEHVPVGCNSYSVSDNDQGNWNGFVGLARLIVQPDNRLLYDQTQIYPNVSSQSAKIRLRLGMKSNKPEKLKLQLSTEAGKVVQPIELTADSQSVEITLKGLNQLWDEYSPFLYHLNIQLLDRKGRECDSQRLSFGMREVSTDQHFVLVNGRRTYLRGTVDGAQFPVTGYPPMDRGFWSSYFEHLKSWGINLVRFHSWCPPEAAFAVADSMGMYLQVECSSWPNHDVNLSPGNATAQYIEQETEQILQAYGNHPSLLLLAAGNEPKGRDYQFFARKWSEENRRRDPRHLYYAFAVGGSWEWTYSNQVQVRAGYRGVDWDRKRPESLSDFNAAIDTMHTPLIGHEVGQWATFPALTDIPKFSGLMQPSHSIICRDMLQQKGMMHLADSFLLASGRLQVLCYKWEMERIRRTRCYGGYNLQALTDYTGQGTANEGILNVFGEPKGYVQPDEWLQWAGEVVPLMRTAKFFYTTADTLRFKLELSNMGRGALSQLPASFSLRNEQGEVLLRKDYDVRDYAWGGGIPIGEEAIALSKLALAGATRLSLRVDVGPYHNDWNLWVYPAVLEMNPGDIHICTTLDAESEQILAQGGKVLLLGYNEVNSGRNIKQALLPEFWNHLWTARYSSHTHGLLIAEHHPVFRHFPTSYHSDLPWWELVNRTYPICLDSLPEITPIVRTIDNAYENRHLGMLFEVRIGHGRLLVTNMDLSSKLHQRRVAKQLYYSILQYMQSADFNPQQEISIEKIRSLF